MLDDANDVHEEVVDNDSNLWVYDGKDREIDYRHTLMIVTTNELIKLVITRHSQINDPNSEHRFISKKILDEYGSSAPLLTLILAEIADETIDYPLTIERGSKQMRLHKDLVLLERTLDIFVMLRNDGSISYDSVLEDLKNRPHAEIQAQREDLENLKQYN